MAGLFYLALRFDGRERPFALRLRWTVLLTVCWAALDELHQAFVPGRGAHVTDVLIDSLGGLVMLSALLVWRWWHNRRPPNRTTHALV